VFNPKRQLDDHARRVTYEMRLPAAAAPTETAKLYVLRPPTRKEREEAGAARDTAVNG
jgi:hypothetical protein